MMISWYGNAFFIIGPLWGDSSSKGPVMQSLDVFFYVPVNKLLNSLIAGNLRCHNAHVVLL